MLVILVRETDFPKLSSLQSETVQMKRNTREWGAENKRNNNNNNKEWGEKGKQSFCK